MENTNIEMQSFLKVEIKQSFDFVSKEQIEEYVVKIDIKEIQGGLIAKLGVYDFAILTAIASYCDCEGEAFPSQRTLAKQTGMSLPQVSKVVNRLLGTTINGKRVLERRMETGNGNTKFSVYSLSGFESQAFNQLEDGCEDVVEEIKDEDKRKLTSRAIVTKFRCTFADEFGFDYVINYARDTSQVKKKLVGSFDDDDMIGMIEYAIKHYKSKWANPRYPFPTISMLCTWLGNQVMAEIKEQQRDQEELQERIKATESYKDESYNDFDSI